MRSESGVAPMSDRAVQPERHRGGNRDGNQCHALSKSVRVDVASRGCHLGERNDISGIEGHAPGERTVLRASEVRAKA